MSPGIFPVHAAITFITPGLVRISISNPHQLSNLGLNDKNGDRFEYLIVLAGDPKTRSHAGNH